MFKVFFLACMKLLYKRHSKLLYVMIICTKSLQAMQASFRNAGVYHSVNVIFLLGTQSKQQQQKFYRNNYMSCQF